MIIDIQGIPEGQKLKSIKFEMQFENDDSVPVWENNSKPQVEKPKQETKVSQEPISDDRPDAPIPEEMLDVVF